MGPKGRTPLANHPDLKVTAAGPDLHCIEYLASDGAVRGVSPGESELVFHWKNLPEFRLPISVSRNAVDAIRVVPVEAAVAKGSRADFQVFGKRNGEWAPLSTAGGVKLSVADPSIADIVGGLQVEGVRSGATSVVATYEGLRAAAALQVLSPRILRRFGARRRTRCSTHFRSGRCWVKNCGLTCPRHKSCRFARHGSRR